MRPGLALALIAAGFVALPPRAEAGCRCDKDHDHLVIAIHGDVEGHGRPKAGATEPFDLSIVTTLADRPGANHAILRVIEWSDECARG